MSAATSRANRLVVGIQIALEKDIGDDRLAASTIGATMMISERPNNPRGRNRFEGKPSATIRD